MSAWPDVLVSLLAKFPDSTPAQVAARLAGRIGALEAAGPPNNRRAVRSYNRRLGKARRQLAELQRWMEAAP